MLIHAAWKGIHEKERNNWELQFINFEFSRLLFDTVAACGVDKIIAIGSQAEYGVSEKPCVESMAALPVDAYGAVKLLTTNYLNTVCREKKIPWYWLRVFSIFGPGDNNTWLIPRVIQNLINHQEIELTEGKQKYDYLFIEDFIECINRIINCNEDFTGIYNICSGRSIEIRQVLTLLAERIGVPLSMLKFGSVSYRDNQNRTISGDCSKFENTFGKINFHDLSESLDETIKYNKVNLKTD
jgi:nucleoside-diphosphate-sugar epimerase